MVIVYVKLDQMMGIVLRHHFFLDTTDWLAGWLYHFHDLRTGNNLTTSFVDEKALFDWSSLPIFQSVSRGSILLNLSEANFMLQQLTLPKSGIQTTIRSLPVLGTLKKTTPLIFSSFCIICKSEQLSKDFFPLSSHFLRHTFPLSLSLSLSQWHLSSPSLSEITLSLSVSLTHRENVSNLFSYSFSPCRANFQIERNEGTFFSKASSIQGTICWQQPSMRLQCDQKKIAKRL